MFHSLAPTGLSPPTRRKVYHLDNDFNQVFLDFMHKFCKNLERQDVDFDIHSYLIELVKYVKKALMDGLVLYIKVYNIFI